MHNPHAKWSENRNCSVERTRVLAPGNVRVWKEVSEATAVEEHGYLRSRDDDTRGKRTSRTTIIPPKFMTLSIGCNTTSAVRPPRD